MIAGILSETKTETRRMDGLKTFNENPDEWIFVRMAYNSSVGLQAFFIEKDNPTGQYGARFPFGDGLGSKLWVREKFRYCQPFGPESLRFEYADGIYSHDEVKETFRINDYEKWRPSIHMPKAAARIFLEITELTVERLQDISEESAIQEGIQRFEPWPEVPDKPRYRQYGIKNIPMNGEATVFDPVV